MSVADDFIMDELRRHIKDKGDMMNQIIMLQQENALLSRRLEEYEVNQAKAD